MFVRVFAKQEIASTWQLLHQPYHWHRRNYRRFDHWARQLINRWTARVAPGVVWRTHLLNFIFRQHIMDWLSPSVPNALGFFRIGLAPVIGWLLCTEQRGLGLCLFVVAAITDALDGEIARRKKCQTPFGKILDPVADKAVFIPTFIILAFGKIPPTLIIMVLLLEAALMTFGLVGWIQSRGKLQKRFRRRRLGANTAGKIKFNLQVLTVVMLVTNATSVAMVCITVALLLASCSLFGHYFILDQNDHSS